MYRALSLLPMLLLSQACETTVVTPVDIQVEVVPGEITLEEGNREAVSAFLRETGGDALSGGRVTWSVDDPRIATITSDGLIEALSVGTTLIRATLGDVSGTAVLRVLPLDEPPGPACEIRDNTISGDLRIPRSTTCVLHELEVEGRLLLEDGATVTGSDVTVHGNVEAKDARELTLTDALVFGDVRFEEGGSVRLLESYVGGKVELKSNAGSIELRANVIEEDVKLEKNRTGPFRLVGNTIDGKLECKDNSPLPSGSGNVAEQLTGQCSGL